MKAIGVSVKNLVQTALRKGHIDNRYVARNRAEEGSIVHRIIQKTYSEDDRREVSVSYSWEKNDINLIIGGRIDGILNVNTDPTIEEIKSTNLQAEDIEEPFRTHLAQAKAYAFIYAADNSLGKIKVRMNYYSLSEKVSKYFLYEYTFTELEEFFNDICEKYFMYVELKLSLSDDINKSIEECTFPFEYRKYQRQVIAKIYTAQNEGKNIFICAPTGTGKTINALFPSLKKYPSLREGKIFYLTAKSTQKNVALYNLSLLKDRGLKAVTVEITAKEKACRMDTPSCNPDDCPYARDYYDKLWEVTNDILKNETLIDKNVINEYAEKYTVCPFELSLDMSDWSDIIVCDYNYVFDPAAALRRYFEEKGGEYIFLIDEAHNLISRSREMYSAQLSKKKIFSAANKVKANKKLNPHLRKIHAKFAEYQKSAEEDGILILEGVEEYIISLLYKFQAEADKFLTGNPQADGYDEIYELYFDMVAFLRIYDLMSDSHIVYYDMEEESLILFCTDAKEYLSSRLKTAKSAVFFSATLSPLSYYCELLGGESTDYLLNVPSSFDKDKFEITADLSVKTTYAHRNAYYPVIADKIYKIINEKPANYMVFFPSYEFMQKVYDIYEEKYPTLNIVMTKRGLTEKERDEIISLMTPDADLSLFAVSGGVFSEGIDLTGEKLYGAIIVGCALPMVSVKNELIRSHFEENGRDGFEYAYIIPAMNKVLQSMGRVIRTSDDEGIAYLMDERFAHAKYRRCFPQHYDNIRFVR
ncbi:MAG: ATP-dependent DNA helicase [Anaerofustis stercorihominis]|nr:ATP-dependent DNA helicase [Anaerofustis stercorihominis]